MSRTGKQPVAIPSGVTAIYENEVIIVKGPKGELTLTPNPKMLITLSETEFIVKRPDDTRESRELHGLTRSLIANMVEGVTNGFQKKLEVNGVGYRFEIKEKKIVLSLGYSHPIEYTPTEGVELKPDEVKKNMIVVSGIDKQKVGQAAAEIRSFRKPEPYKGKGIKYENEIIHRKAGKTAAKAG